MTRVSRTRIQEYIHLGQSAQHPRERGNALEELICYAFGKIPGLELAERQIKDHTGTQEIDVAFRNGGHPHGLPRVDFPFLILIECKNWSEPVGSTEVAWFVKKLENRGIDFGVLVAANGITGDSATLSEARGIIADALRSKLRIIVFTLDDLRELTDSAQLVRAFKRKLEQLHLRRTSLD